MTWLAWLLAIPFRLSFWLLGLIDPETNEFIRKEIREHYAKKFRKEKEQKLEEAVRKRFPRTGRIG